MVVAGEGVKKKSFKKKKKGIGPCTRCCSEVLWGGRVARGARAHFWCCLGEDLQELGLEAAEPRCSSSAVLSVRLRARLVEEPVPGGKGCSQSPDAFRGDPFEDGARCHGDGLAQGRVGAWGGHKTGARHPEPAGPPLLSPPSQAPSVPSAAPGAAN